MNKFLLRVLPLFTLVVLLTNCRKKEWDDYYARPESLEPHIYQILETKGNFKTLLSIIDKAGYKHTLSSAGYWTMFAPSDSAFANDNDFKTYLQQKNIADVNAMDSTTARSIVQYLLVYNAFNKDRIDDYQANAGWVPDNAFRRRTAYYTGFYTDPSKGDSVFLANNRNGAIYEKADNNNKYISYFTSAYFDAKKLTAADYNYFYPNTTFSGFNVANAKVVNADLAAENGIIHTLDHVITPQLSIDEYLASKPEYAEFKKLFDKYMVTYQPNTDATQKFQVLSGLNKQVYIKMFNAGLAYSPNNENFVKLQDNDGQQDAYSVVVPSNTKVIDYLKNVLLEYYDRDLNNLYKLPSSVIIDFLNAHMWQTALWPSRFDKTLNTQGEEARIDPNADVTEKKILSNGMFYGTTKVQEANVFSTVYSRAYLDPKYSIMSQLFNEDYNVKGVANSSQKVTLFMMSDQALTAAGFDYKPALKEWGYTPAGGTRTTGEAVRQRLLRILNTSLVLTPKGELNDFTSGTGIIDAYNGESLRYKDSVINGVRKQVVTSSGLADNGTWLQVDSSRTMKNGKVYYVNGLLTYSEKALSQQILALGGTSAANSEYYYFTQLLVNSTVYNITTFDIEGMTAGTFYTVLAPNNAAIMQAVKDGMLPGSVSTGIPTVAPTTPADKTKVSTFLLYHFIAKRSLLPNGNEPGSAFETLLKNSIGDPLYVTGASTALGVLNFIDNSSYNRPSIILGKSNNLGTRAVIHLIDKYLKYSY